MFDMMATPGISCRLMMQYAPVTARRMCMAHTSSLSSSDLVRVRSILISVRLRRSRFRPQKEKRVWLRMRSPS
ncbi:MAG: hypothetical protein HC767_07680 [Akkermansiaceae bacterium]|nr:hypothetical protein [Akkermansiaceae bacterium]